MTKTHFNGNLWPLTATQREFAKSLFDVDADLGNHVSELFRDGASLEDVTAQLRRCMGVVESRRNAA